MPGNLENGSVWKNESRDLRTDPAQSTVFCGTTPDVDNDEYMDRMGGVGLVQQSRRRDVERTGRDARISRRALIIQFTSGTGRGVALRYLGRRPRRNRPGCLSGTTGNPC